MKKLATSALDPEESILWATKENRGDFLKVTKRKDGNWDLQLFAESEGGAAQLVEADQPFTEEMLDTLLGAIKLFGGWTECAASKRVDGRSLAVRYIQLQDGFLVWLFCEQVQGDVVYMDHRLRVFANFSDGLQMLARFAQECAPGN